MDNEDKFLNEAKKNFKFRKISLYLVYSSVFTMFPVGIVCNKFFTANISIIIVVTIYIIMVVTSFVLDLIYWKCPKCKKNFSIRHGSMDNISICPYCGVKLRNNNYYR